MNAFQAQLLRSLEIFNMHKVFFFSFHLVIVGMSPHFVLLFFVSLQLFLNRNSVLHHSKDPKFRLDGIRCHQRRERDLMTVLPRLIKFSILEKS